MLGRVALRAGHRRQRHRVLPGRRGYVHVGGVYRMCRLEQWRADRGEPLHLHVHAGECVLQQYV